MHAFFHSEHVSEISITIDMPDPVPVKANKQYCCQMLMHVSVHFYIATMHIRGQDYIAIQREAILKEILPIPCIVEICIGTSSSRRTPITPLS